MREQLCTFDYATIRFVPRVEREEFTNVGVILSCPSHKFLESGIYLAEPKLNAFAPTSEIKTIREFLQIIPQICAGAGVIGKLPQRERFYWLTAQRSTIIQCSPVHTGFCDNPKETLENLLDKMVR